MFSHHGGVINILQGIYKKLGLPLERESGSGTRKFLPVESGIRETFAYGICNPGPYFGIQLKESRTHFLERWLILIQDEAKF